MALVWRPELELVPGLVVLPVLGPVRMGVDDSVAQLQHSGSHVRCVPPVHRPSRWLESSPDVSAVPWGIFLVHGSIHLVLLIPLFDPGTPPLSGSGTPERDNPHPKVLCV